MVTIKKIAELCGVSRGTVDRALNGRGRVSEKTAQYVRQMAEQLGYEPNPAGKALAARKNKPVVGVIISSQGNAFFDDVINGLETAAKEYKIYGAKLQMHTLKGYYPEEQLAVLTKMWGKIAALIINPIDDKRIATILNKYEESGVLVIALNNDISSCNRRAYVGSDYINGGETACALFNAIMGKEAEVGIVIGDNHIMGHQQRVAGFKARMANLSGFHIAQVIQNSDDDICSYNRTKEMLQAKPEINALFLAAGGSYGACRAVMELPEAHRPLVIAFDSVPATVEMMRQGIVRAIIYQHPFRQGNLAARLAFEYVVQGKVPTKDKYIMKNDIKLLENL